MSRASLSNSATGSIIDTVVLNYFLLVEHHELLIDLLGNSASVTRIVFDPDEELGIQPVAMSEISRGIDRFRGLSVDSSRRPDEREQYSTKSRNLAAIRGMVASEKLTVVDMTISERAIFGTLTSPERAQKAGLKFPLGAGEAASVAIAIERQWTLVTDDGDAISALTRLSPGHPAERIRGLLIQAARKGLITKARANSIHEAMREQGFWDREAPFPR